MSDEELRRELFQEKLKILMRADSQDPIQPTIHHEPVQQESDQPVAVLSSPTIAPLSGANDPLQLVRNSFEFETQGLNNNGPREAVSFQPMPNEITVHHLPRANLLPNKTHPTSTPSGRPESEWGSFWSDCLDHLVSVADIYNDYFQLVVDPGPIVHLSLVNVPAIDCEPELLNGCGLELAMEAEAVCEEYERMEPTAYNVKLNSRGEGFDSEVLICGTASLERVFESSAYSLDNESAENDDEPIFALDDTHILSGEFIDYIQRCYEKQHKVNLDVVKAIFNLPSLENADRAKEFKSIYTECYYCAAGDARFKKKISRIICLFDQQDILIDPIVLKLYDELIARASELVYAVLDKQVRSAVVTEALYRPGTKIVLDVGVVYYSKVFRIVGYLASVVQW